MRKYNPNSLANLKQYFKPKWNDTKTKLSRVPMVLEKQILDYAYQLDDGTISPPNSIVKGDCNAKISEIMAKSNNQEKGYGSNSAL